jgi:hypothetical protein
VAYERVKPTRAIGRNLGNVFFKDWRDLYRKILSFSFSLIWVKRVLCILEVPALRFVHLLAEEMGDKSAANCVHQSYFFFRVIIVPTARPFSVFSKAVIL